MRGQQYSGSEFATMSHDSSFGFSKTLRVHLQDIDILAESGATQEALRVAAQLPHVCVALEDEDMRSSFEQYQTWCETWLAPIDLEGTGAPLSCYALLGALEKYDISIALSESGVPLQALRELQKKRLLRSPGERLFPASPSTNPADLLKSETARSVRAAAWRWYTESGSFDLIVQTNLARLAVMR